MKTSGQADSPAKPEQQHAGLRAITEQYYGAWANLATGLQERLTTYQKHQHEAWKAFEKVSKEVEHDTAEHWLEAYRDYAKAAQDAMLSNDPQQRFQEAYQNYAATMQRLQEAAMPRLQEAYRDMMEEASRSGAEVQEQMRQQYTDYLARIKRIWADLKPELLA